ncbi:MAG TPA: hypothetical protein VGR35_02820 [Tepidisphaeraceae bacterium]|nr:hypothetical protein [Tepidisphaeraceae bacterium]
MISDPPPLRYAVLRHQGIDAPHVDLLFETAPGSMLQTWRLPTWPIREVEEATRIRDHRPAFLTYQGQLTGDRGHVQRIDEGTCTFEASPRRLLIQLAWSNQRLLFEQDPGGDTWHVRAVPLAPATPESRML